MKRAVFVALALVPAIDPAAACHKYSVWKYPKPQSCRATALAHAMRLPQTKIDVGVLDAPRAHRPPMMEEFSLPSLSDIEWGQPPDDEMRGRLLLRVIMQGEKVSE